MIATVLVVTVTVLLAAVFGTSLLVPATQLVDDPAPQTGLSVEVDAAANEITISHRGGDGIDSARTRLVVSVGETKATFDPTASSHLLTVSERAVITTDGGGSPDDGVDWNGDGLAEAQPQSGSDVLPPIHPGDTVTVRLVDNIGELVFFDASVQA